MSTYCDASLDPALEHVLVLELGALGRDEPEDHLLALGHETQRLEAAGALVVELEEVAVDVQVAEQRLGDEVVAALGGPHRLVVAAAQVRGDGHVRRLVGERAVDVPDVLLVQVLGVAADRLDVLALGRVVDVGEARVVELQVAAAELVDAVSSCA